MDGAGSSYLGAADGAIPLDASGSGDGGRMVAQPAQLPQMELEPLLRVPLELVKPEVDLLPYDRLPILVTQAPQSPDLSFYPPTPSSILRLVIAAAIKACTCCRVVASIAVCASCDRYVASIA